MGKRTIEPWRSHDGKIISILDCIQALQTAKAVIIKELHFNKKIIDNPKVKEDYERKLEILDHVQNAYEDAAREMQKGIVTMKPPGKKTH